MPKFGGGIIFVFFINYNFLNSPPILSIQLDISGIMASPESLRDLSESLPKLRSIAYRGMIHTNERAFWYFFKAIAAQLRSLDVRGCVRLRGRFFKLFSAEFEEVVWCFLG